MKVSAGYIVACVILVLSTASAQAQTDVNIGGTTIKLPVPEGFCPLDPSNPVEKSYLNSSNARAGPTSEVLSLFWECKTLAAWRSGAVKLSFEPEMAIYMTSKQFKSKTVTAAETIPRLCANFRAGSQARLNKNAKEHSPPNATINAARYGNGVLHEDAATCYTSLVSEVSIAKQKVTKLSINAMAIVKGKLVFFNRTTDFTDETVVPILLAQMRETVASLARSNE